MVLLVKNCNSSLRFSLNVLKIFGFLVPNESRGNHQKYSTAYWIIWFMYIVGIMTICQAGEILQIWGDIPLMTSASYLLFTNLALSIKIINVATRRRQIQAIIDQSDEELRTECRREGVQIVKDCNRETTVSLVMFMWLSAMTVFGWASGAEKNQLPLRAWYPYDTSKSPAYELTYLDQTSALIISALVNVCLDTLVTSSIALCRCRLRLVRLSLRTLCDEVPVIDKHLLRLENDETVYTRLKICVFKHNSALSAAAQIQTCFNEPILAQFTVSTVIICVTAYQLAMELLTKNLIRIIGMVAYLFCMMLQIFLYCYQGNQLSEECSEISDAAYECPWHACSVRTRRALLVVMVRSRRVVTLNAGGFTTLSLNCFTSIIKASYTFFTVLRQVEIRN